MDSGAENRPSQGPGEGQRPLEITILGGGTAGYLTALALRAKRPELKVTLIESSKVPVIGVGEATTPLLPQFLHADLGLDIHRLWAEVRPTLKLGIRFGWGEANFNYPFGPLRLLEPAVHDGGVEAASLRSLLMSHRRLPWFRGDDGGGGGDSDADGGSGPRLGTAFAYHLDNRRFVAYLRRRAAEVGVEPVDATIAEVRLDPVGSGAAGPRVEELVAEDGRRFRCDFLVDCSGFRSLLLGDALASPWHSFSGSLFTDRALVATAPAAGDASEEQGLPPYTAADTWDAGWCWSIPQRGGAEGDGAEIHHGYVYASSFLDDDGAAAELARRWPDTGPPRRVVFRAGRHHHFVHGNVAALGNAYGFVEPLESTSLHLLVRQIGLLVRLLPWHPDEADGRLALANRRVAGWWDYVAWFLALHFRFNRRSDTSFWRACREKADVSAFGELLETYRRRGPLSADPSLPALFEAPDPLWGPAGIDLLLLAQGVPCPLPTPHADLAEHREWVTAAKGLAARALPQRRALELLDGQAELRDALIADIMATGPAFP